MWHLLERAKLLIVPDTGIAHLGRVAGVPTLALFGPGSALLSGAGEFWRDSPYTALTIPDFPCRDQTVTMRRNVRWIRRCERFQGTAPGLCPEARCMLALSTDDVSRAAVQLLSVPKIR
jgi:ADP-heptose:LPS heptosyltransferase